MAELFGQRVCRAPALQNAKQIIFACHRLSGGFLRHLTSAFTSFLRAFLLSFSFPYSMTYRRSLSGQDTLSAFIRSLSWGKAASEFVKATASGESSRGDVLVHRCSNAFWVVRAMASFFCHLLSSSNWSGHVVQSLDQEEKVQC